MVNRSTKDKVRISKPKTLNIFHQNIRGLRFKFNELLCHFEEKLPQILCFAEHHLSREELMHLNLDIYTLGAHYCRSQYKKGGTCIYIHKSLKFVTINLDKFCHERDMEACAISLNISNCKIIILTIYRAPASNYELFLDKLELILQKISKKYVNLILCGDFNVNYMDNCNKKVKLDDLLGSYNLKSIITFPTRIGVNSATIIDNIFIDELQFINYEVSTLTNGLSDHEAQLLTLQLSSHCSNKTNIPFIRVISDYNVLDFNMKLSYEEWELVFKNNDVNISFNYFLNILLNHFYASFPLKKTQANKQKSWITAGIKTSCRNKRLLYAEVKKSSNPLVNAYYKKYCKILNRVINLAKKMAYDHQINFSKNKARTSWKIINNEVLKKTKNENVQTLNIKGKKDSNVYAVVEAFNKYFSEVADKIHKKIKGNDDQKSTNHNEYMGFMTEAFRNPFKNLTFTKTTNKEIEKIIGSLKSSFSQGYDEISNNILKACKNYISVPLSYLCNIMLFEGVYPERLKYAIILPVHKKGDRNMVTNYRPISILTSINKIFEKVMYSRLLNHLKENCILSDHQFGF
jgi:exonuclease III